jgi:(2Fe-2S) ferredoxin
VSGMTTWNLEGMQHHLLICNGGSCMRKGGEEVTQAIREEISIRGVDSLIHTTRTRCNGRCEDACVVISYPEGIWYRNITPQIGRKIVGQLIEKENHIHSHISYTYNNHQFLLSPNASIGINKK